MTGPNLNLLNDMARHIYKMENSDQAFHREIELKKVKQGQEFKRKPTAKTIYTKEHYNRKDAFGPASFTCVDTDDIGRSIELKPTTVVYIEI
jgi:hypothetical protein